jgi:hypothetical protein
MLRMLEQHLLSIVLMMLSLDFEILYQIKFEFVVVHHLDEYD